MLERPVDRCQAIEAKLNELFSLEQSIGIPRAVIGRAKKAATDTDQYGNSRVDWPKLIEWLMSSAKQGDPKSYLCGILAKLTKPTNGISVRSAEWHDLPPHYQYVMTKNDKILFRAGNDERWVSR